MTDDALRIDQNAKVAMHASAVLQTWLASVFSRLDQRNVQAASEAVCAGLNARRLTLMALARHGAGFSPDCATARTTGSMAQQSFDAR
ncbi:hypothetical protein ACS8YF_19465 [Salinisphaera sp. SWV1]|uniref:hypothetical protein n=1 Tax=Salinisphaera sp. SWV1 TaxID=3454139 RepID=UPI003F858ED5